jgi:hypothetical protein
MGELPVTEGPLQCGYAPAPSPASWSFHHPSPPMFRSMHTDLSGHFPFWNLHAPSPILPLLSPPPGPCVGIPLCTPTWAGPAYSQELAHVLLPMHHPPWAPRQDQASLLYVTALSAGPWADVHIGHFAHWLLTPPVNSQFRESRSDFIGTFDSTVTCTSGYWTINRHWSNELQVRSHDTESGDFR